MPGAECQHQVPGTAGLTTREQRGLDLEAEDFRNLPALGGDTLLCTPGLVFRKGDTGFRSARKDGPFRVITARLPAALVHPGF